MTAGTIVRPVSEHPNPHASQDRRRRFRGSLRARTARGTMINAAFTVGLDSIAFLKGFLLAGFLTQDDYGIWGILVIGLGTLLWLKQVGIGDKYVQQEDEDQELAFQKAFTLELIFSGGFFLLLLAALPLIALAYDEPKIVAPGLVTSLAVLAGIFQTPMWVYYRNMEFARQRALQAVDPIVGFVVAITLAVNGAGYWALVLGILAGAWSGAIVAVIASPYRLRLRYDRGTMREYAGFSVPLLLASASGIVIAQGAMLVSQHAIGLAAVGAVTLASTISIYVDRVDRVVTTALYPAICAVRDRTDLLFESFVKSNRLTLMWGVPFGVGLALFAPDLVDYGIGDQWKPAVGLIQAFGLIAAANHVGFNWDAFYRARGTTRPLAIHSAITMLAFLAFVVPLTILAELDGLALGMGLMASTSLIVRTVFLMRLFPGFHMLRHMARAFAPTVPATAAVLGLRLLDGLERSAPLAIAELALYGAITVAATLALERPLLREMVGYLRSRRGPAAGLAT